MKSLFKIAFQNVCAWIATYRSLPVEKKRIALTKTLMFLVGWLTINYCFAQDGNSGINSATTQVKGYFDSGCNLMYAIGAVVGIIGAIKVFNKWNAGEPDTNKVAAAWFGSCVFLVVVATVLKSFFGL
ncbi:protein of unknown function [Mucilaginibacter gossypii]|uniref:Uncharacterized protein n=2 Tax=Sphingobacteriaceae TaxID=84566 RepID=A0A1G8D6K7_9SPHI|nr:protein of unknown function [Mucilaginibacter gossypii]